MIVTEKSMRAAYRFLKDSVFSDVPLPSVDGIQFKKKRLKDLHGFYEMPPHRITIDTATHSYEQLLQIMAHEIVHVALEQTGAHGHEEHNAPFKALAEAVCIDMGWPKGSV
jgi:predicted SprT family Zn-dependent metalloprotease